MACSRIQVYSLTHREPTLEQGVVPQLLLSRVSQLRRGRSTTLGAGSRAAGFKCPRFLTKRGVQRNSSRRSRLSGL